MFENAVGDDFLSGCSRKVPTDKQAVLFCGQHFVEVDEINGIGFRQLPEHPVELSHLGIVFTSGRDGADQDGCGSICFALCNDLREPIQRFRNRRVFNEIVSARRYQNSGCTDVLLHFTDDFQDTPGVSGRNARIEVRISVTEGQLRPTEEMAVFPSVVAVTVTEYNPFEIGTRTPVGRDLGYVEFATIHRESQSTAIDSLTKDVDEAGVMLE